MANQTPYHRLAGGYGQRRVKLWLKRRQGERANAGYQARPKMGTYPGLHGQSACSNHSLRIPA